MRRSTILLAALLAPVPALAAEHGPCQADEDRLFCRWTVDVRDGRTDLADFWELPAFERTLATFIVTVTGRDNGWHLAIQRHMEDGSWRQVSFATHAATVDASYSHQDESAHLLVTDGPAEHRVVFSRAHVATAVSDLTPGAPPGGKIEITYHAQRIPEGAAPARPAATADDPHLLDFLDDAPDPAHDIVAAWLDDARVGDGLMDAHLRVRDLNVTPAAFVSPTTGHSHEFVTWKLAWRVRDAPYQVVWFASPSGSTTCQLRTEAQAESDSEAILLVPHCAYDVANGTLHASFPESAIGAPAPGERFADLAARTRLATLRHYEVVDEVVLARYPFALGGPDVWSALNPRLDPPPVVVPAWYEEPLREENLPDTLQVAGAVLASLTFLGGLVLVARRRRVLRRHLDRVDAVERAHERDAHGALLALGRLEADFTGLFRAGRLTEGQYQALSARVASAAARMAVRRELGLDDGVPGDAGPEGGVRIPVRSS